MTTEKVGTVFVTDAAGGHTAFVAGVDRTAIVDGVDVDAVAAAVSRCPGVAGLGSRFAGAMATYLPGRRVVPGVRVSDDRLELDICAAWGPSAEQIARQIRAAVARLVDRRVDILISDIRLPGEPDPDTPLALGPAPHRAALSAPTPAPAASRAESET